MRDVWEVLHVLAFCYGMSAFCDMILCSVVVLHLAVRLAVLVCWFHALFHPSLTLDVSPCYDALLCTDTCWLACWTCMSLGQAAVVVRRVSAIVHIRLWRRALLTSVHKTSVQRWIMEANWQRHQRASASTVNGFTIWCLNGLHKHWHHRTCRSFIFSGHYELAVFILDRQAH